MSTYATLLVTLTGAGDDASALAVASALAAHHQSLAKVQLAFPDPAADLVAWGGLSGVYLSAEVLEQIAAAEAESRAKLTELAERAAGQAGLAWGPGEGGGRMVVQERGLASWLALLRALPLTDLVIMSRESAHGAAVASGPLADALMQGRAPVLITRGAEAPIGATVAIAWDASLEAGRAVRAALPLLKAAKQVVILQDPAELDEEERTSADPRDLGRYLAMHGIATVETAGVAGGDEGHALLAAAAQRGAKLLVAGAYGHSRMREWVLGGATRAFLESKSGPHLLIAH